MSQLAHDLRNSAPLNDPKSLARALGLKFRGGTDRSINIQCPWHEDKNPSCALTVRDDGTVSAKCFSCSASGDALSLIAEVRNISLTANFHDVLREACSIAGRVYEGPMQRENFGGNGASRTVVAYYVYRDEQGAPLSRCVRFAPKDFRHERAMPDGSWESGVGDVRRVLYKLPEVLAAEPAVPVFLVEGEKDCDTAWKLGLVATSIPNGVGYWGKLEEHVKQVLAGRIVVIIADKDAPGREFASKAVKTLAAVTRGVAVIEMPGPPEVKDLTDAVDAGLTKDDAIALAREQLIKEVSQQGYSVPSRWLSDAPEARKWLLKDSRHPASPGVLPMGKTGQILGEGGVSKTMAIIQLALAVATATPWLGTFSVPAAGRVLLLLGEEDAEECHRRFYHAARASGITSIGTGSVVVRPLAGTPTPLVDCADRGALVETAHADELRRYIRSQSVPFSLVVLDPLSRFAGKDAETDNAAATRFVQVLESFAMLGPTVLVAHHTNKGARGINGKVTASSARGSSALIDGVRWACSLGHQEIEGLQQEETERLGKSVLLSFTKSNYSIRGDDLMLRRSLDHGGALVPFDDADVETAHAASSAKSLGRSSAKEQARQDEFERAMSSVCRIVDANPGLNSRELELSVEQEAKCSDRTAKKAVIKAKTERIIRFEQRGKGLAIFPTKC